MGPKRPKQNLKPAESQYPTPFTKAPPSIDSFLTQLDTAQVYITHVERLKPEFKKQIFGFAVFVNSTITALLLWRVYVAAPKYLALVQTFLGYVSSATVDTKATTRKAQFWILFRRFAMFLMDYLLFYFITPWPISFFFERPANPVTWRWNIGFPQLEVVVRASRHWGTDDLMKSANRGDQSPFWKTRVLPAITKEMMEKTAYLLMGGSWDLDFGLIQDAHALIKQDRLKIEDLDNLVLVHQEGAGWLAYRFGSKEEGEGDNVKKMMAFKEFMAAMGKESLFWKWQEIVEDERQADGGITPEAQQRISKRVTEEFSKAGVDFQDAVELVGNIVPAPVTAS